MSSSAGVTLYYVKETLTALDQFDKEAVKAFKKTVNKELVHLRTYARTNIPDVAMSHWKNTIPLKPHANVRGGKGWPAWDVNTVIADIVTSRKAGKINKRAGYTTVGGAIINQSAAGAIFEVAGRGNKRRNVTNSKSGAQFIANLNRHASPSRAIYKAIDKHGDKARKEIMKAFAEVENNLRKRLGGK